MCKYSEFQPISWTEAYELIATRFLRLRDSGDARSIANKTSGRLPRGTGSLVNPFFSLLGSPNDTDVGSRYGLPVSTTHVSMGSLFGIGLAGKSKNYRAMSGMVLSWVLTLPFSAVRGAIAYSRGL